MGVRIHKEKVTTCHVERVLALGILNVREDKITPVKKYKKVCLSYQDTKRIVNSLGITTRKAYLQLYESGNVGGLSSNPPQQYKDAGWAGWNEFFDIPVKPSFMSYTDAKNYIISKGIRSGGQYRKARNNMLIIGVPSDPSIYYEEWAGWDCFTGKDVIQRHLFIVIAALEKGYRQDFIEKYPEIRETVYKLSNPASPDYNREFTVAYGYQNYFNFSLD